MTDLNSEPDYFSPDEEDLRQGAELLFHACRDADFEPAAGFAAILRAIVDKSATPRTGHLRPSQRPAGSGAGYRP